MKNLVLLGLCVFVLSSCSEQANGPDQSQLGKGWLGSILVVSDMDELIDDVDTTNVRGLVILEQEYAEIRDWDSSRNVPVWTGHEARAYFHPSIDSSVSIGDIEVNGVSLDIGGFGFAYGIDGIGLQSYFDLGSSTNSIKKGTPDTALGILDTSVSFQQKVRFVGLSRGDQIDISAGKTFSFVGYGGYMQLLITISKPDDPNESGGHSYSKIFDGAGSISLNSGDLSNIVSGKGDVTVTKWEPKILNTTNGKKIAFVAKTIHTVSVEIRD